MAFKNLKVTCVKAEGPCSRTEVGATFYVRDAKLELPPGQSICIFALGSVLQPISGAIIENREGEGLLDVLEDRNELSFLPRMALQELS